MQKWVTKAVHKIYSSRKFSEEVNSSGLQDDKEKINTKSFPPKFSAKK